MLLAPPNEELPDEEIAGVLRQSIVDAGCLSRHADVFLAGICADHLVNGLRRIGRDTAGAMAPTSVMGEFHVVGCVLKPKGRSKK